MNPSPGFPAELPVVWMNVAISADGKIAPANRHYTPFGSARDHDLLLELRSQVDAVICGARTVDLFPANLGPGNDAYRAKRLARGLQENNLRVVVSGDATLDPSAEIFRETFSPVLVLTAHSAPPKNVARLREVAHTVEAFGEKSLDVAAALTWLKREWRVQTLLCEGGGALNDAFWRAGVVQRLHVTICPLLLGGQNAPTLSDGFGFPHLGDAARLDLLQMTRHGDELFCSYTVRPRTAM